MSTHIETMRPFFNTPPLQLIAITAYGEARGEGERGMQAVINVIHNRRLHPIEGRRRPRFGDNLILEATQSAYHAVILSRLQFCPFRPGDGMRPTMEILASPVNFERELRNRASLRIAWALCDRLRMGQLPDITGGADHFLNPHVAAATARLWDRYPNMRATATIGRHRFWQIIPPLSENPQVYRPSPRFVHEPVPAIVPAAAGLMMLGG